MRRKVAAHHLVFSRKIVLVGAALWMVFELLKEQKGLHQDD